MKPGLDDFLMTPEELALRWRQDVGTLANLRSKNLGLPSIKLPSGAVRYRASDVLDAEINGTRGITANQVAKVVMTYPDLNDKDRRKLASWLEKQLSR